MTPAPSPAENLQFYNRYHKHQNRGHANWLGRIKPISGSNFTYFFHLRALKPLLKQLPQLSILDVGCGVGTLSLYLASQGAKHVVGIDLSTRAIGQAETARRALGLSNLSFHATKLDHHFGRFDLIIASEILEHVPHPANFIKQLYAHLKPGGQLLLTTPYAHNWLRDHGHLRHHDEVAGHLKIYDETSLTKLLFSPQRYWHLISLEKNEGPLRMLLFTTPLGGLIKFIRGPLVPLFHAIDALLGKIWGYHDLLVTVQKT